MAVFRVARTKNFTVMSNCHLRDKSISLKAKGLLSQMLSLPDDWDYTLKGLAEINREQVDAVRTALRELERAGYVEREQLRVSGGRMGGTVYNVYEEPKQAVSPASGQPGSEHPGSEHPISGHPTQRKKDAPKKEKQKTDSINHSVGGAWQDAKALKSEILESVEYDWLVDRHPNDRELLDEIVGLIWQTRCATRPRIRVAGEDFPAELVRERLAGLTAMHVEFVLDRLKRNTADIRNIRAYLLAALFHAPVTMESYYTARVARDVGG